MGPLTHQLDCIKTQTQKRALVVVDRADEWTDHKHIFDVFLPRTSEPDHPFHYLIMGRSLEFIYKLTAPGFSLTDRRLGNLDKLGSKLLRMGPTPTLFDGMLLDTPTARERLPRYEVLWIPELSLKAIVTPFGSVADGVLVKLIDPVYSHLLRAIKRDPAIIHEIDARKWEEIIAAAYDREGFDEVILTPRSGDLGRDVIAIKNGHGSVRFLEQVKAYKQGFLVTAEEVRALAGVLSAEPNASKAIFSTTSHFAPRVATDRLLKPLMPHRLELVDRESLLSRLRIDD